MKKFGIGLGVVIFALVVTGLVVPGFMDWNEHKERVETTASDFLGRKVTIGGDISLSLLPSPSFSAGEVSIANMVGGQVQNMLSLKSLDVKVAFFPLLRGQVKVKKFILVDPVIALEVLEDGRVNWDFGGGNEDPATTTGDFSLDKFQISGGQVSFQDFSTGRRELLRKINAQVSVKSLEGPFDVTGSARYRNLPVELEMEMGKIRDGRKIPLKLVMNYLNGAVETKFLGGIIFEEKGTVAQGRLSLKARDGADLVKMARALDQEKMAAAVQDFGQALVFESDITTRPDHIQLKAIELKFGESRGQGDFALHLKDRVSFEGSLSLNSLDMDKLLPLFGSKKGQGKASNPALKGPENFDLSGLADGNFSFRLGALRYNGKIASQITADLKLEGGTLRLDKVGANMPGGSGASFAGRVNLDGGTPVLKGNIALNSGNLRGLLDWLKMDVSQTPSGRLTRFSLKTGVVADPELLQFYDIDGTLDIFRFKGGLSYALADRTAFGLDMQVENLNLDHYQSKKKKKTPLDLKALIAPLGGFDANYKLLFKNLTVGGIKIKEVALDGTLVGGNLDATIVKLRNFAGFDFSGRLHAKSLDRTPFMEMDFKTSAKSLTALQRAFRFETPFDIKGLGAVQLSGKISGSPEKIDMDVTSLIGSSKLVVKGQVRSATLKQFPDFGSMDLHLTGGNASLVALIDQFDLPLSRVRLKDDRLVHIDVKVKGNQKLINLDGSVDVAGGRVVLKGRSQKQGPKQGKERTFDVAVDLTSPEVREFVRGLGGAFNPSRARLGPLQIKTKLTGSTKKIALSNIVGRVGPVKLSGSGNVDYAAAKPRFDFNLTMGNIPVGDFMEKDKSGKKAKKWGGWTKSPMDLALLKEYDGRAVISATELTYGDYLFGSPRFEAVLKDGVVRINNFTGRFFGGALAMNGSFGGKGKPALEMDMVLTKASFAEATKTSAGIAPVTGYFDMKGKFTGQGISQSALMSSLAGGGEITASPGMINGIDIPKLSTQLAEMKNTKGVLGLLGATLKGGQTPYKGGAGTITASGGKIKLSPLDLELEGAKTGVDITLDLFRWNMDVKGGFSLIDHPEAPAIGLTVTGAIDHPRIKYNTGRLQKYIGAKIASSLLQNLISENSDLKGLFGGQEKPAEEEAVPEEEKPIDQKIDFGKKLLEKLLQNNNGTN